MPVFVDVRRALLAVWVAVVHDYHPALVEHVQGVVRVAQGLMPFVEAVDEYEVELVAVLVEEIVGGHAERGLGVRVHVDLLLALDRAEVCPVGGPYFEETAEAALPDEVVQKVGSCVHVLSTMASWQMLRHNMVIMVSAFLLSDIVPATQFLDMPTNTQPLESL